MLLAYLITLAVPMVILFILYSYDTFGLQPRRSVILALVWGGAAFLISFFAELLALNFASSATVVLVVAPVVEEISKAALIGYLLRRGRLVNAVDGMSTGFEIGLSFGMIENLVYLGAFSGDGSQAIGYAAARVLTAGLLHAFATGMVGAVAGHSARYSRRRQRLYFYGAVGLAIFLHVAYNLVALSFDGTWLLLLTMAIGMTGTGIIMVLIHREVRWVNKRVALLGVDADQPARLAASDPQALHRALMKYEDTLGPDVLKKIERYAYLIGQQAVLQSALDQYGSTRHRDVIRVRLEDIEGQIAVLNADVGLFVRVWMSTLVASDEEVQSALQIAALPTSDDPRLQLALMLARRTRLLSAAEVEARKRALAYSSLFGSLTGTDLEDVALVLDARACQQGEIVLRRGEVNEQTFLVDSGAFEMQMPAPDAHSVQVGRVPAGEIFGMASALGDRRATSDVICTQDGLVYAITKGALFSLVYGNPRIGLVLVRHLAGRVQDWGELIQRMAPLEQAAL